MKKRMFAALLAVSMMIGMTACGSDNSSAGNSASGSSTETAKSDNAGSDSSYDVLNVGTMALTCGIPVLYAEEQGYFKDAGLNVNIEIFATGAPINEAIAANQIDVAVSGFASVYSLANADCSWVADVNTTGGMGLYARSDFAQCAEENGLIGSADTLKGIQILEPLGTAVQYMTESYAEKYGLTPNDINQVNMEYASAYQAFTTGEGDAMAANPPYSLISAQIDATRMATMLVSNIPAAPSPIFPSKSVGTIIPVAIMMMEPLMIPVISTRNTFKPRMPPASTSI